MKTAILALSALLALSGLSMAASMTAQANATAGCSSATGKKVKIDCAKTASIGNAASEGKTSGPRLGIGVSPFVPGL